MSDDSGNKVLGWLKKEGFPLEVRVGQACRSQQWLTFHGFPYTDPVEGKMRECDIFASRHSRAEGGMASVDLAIECKRSPDKPWVVFAEPVKTFDWLLPSMLATGKVSDLCLSLCLPSQEGLDFLRPKHWVGYAVTKAHAGAKDGDPSGAYSALRAAVAAAEALQLKCEERFHTHPEGPPSVDITLPVVVIGAPLYLYTLNEANEERVEEIESARIVAPQREYESRCLLTVVTEAAFEGWLRGVTTWADEVLKEVAPRAHGLPAALARFREYEGQRERRVSAW